MTKGMICLFVCFETHEQYFSYLTTVTITGDMAANLDLCLALTAFSSEGSFKSQQLTYMLLSRFGLNQMRFLMRDKIFLRKLMKTLVRPYEASNGTAGS